MHHSILVPVEIYLTFLYIQIGQRETEHTNYVILVKFSSISKLGVGNDECGQPCAWSSYQYF